MASDAEHGEEGPQRKRQSNAAASLQAILEQRGNESRRRRGRRVERVHKLCAGGVVAEPSTEASRLIVAAVRGARHLAEVGVRGEPHLDVELAPSRCAQVVCRQLDEAEWQLEVAHKLTLKGDETLQLGGRFVRR